MTSFSPHLLMFLYTPPPILSYVFIMAGEGDTRAGEWGLHAVLVANASHAVTQRWSKSAGGAGSGGGVSCCNWRPPAPVD